MATTEDSDDPVVSEVDVFLSKQLAENLYLFQYPVRPAHMTYDHVMHHIARIKPKQQSIELELQLDTQSPNYAHSKGEQIALNVDGAAGSGDGFYHSTVMDKQVISSGPSNISPTRYVTGLFKDNELHLTPMKGIVQLRPDFGYLDRADGRQVERPSGDREEEASQDEEEEAKHVTVRFARRETEDAKARRMASYEYMNKRREEEHWVEVHHHAMNDPVSEYERTLLLARCTTENNEFRIQPDAYLEKLIPKIEEQAKEKPPMPSNVLSLAELKSMPLGDQIKALIKNAKVLRFAQLLALLAKGSDATAALRSLQQVAMLVQGCWVVKSDVLYPKDSCSAYSGAPAENLCRGRDYVMWRFTQRRFLVRKDIASVVRLPTEDLKDVLDQMAVLRVSKGWEFLLEYDHEFVNRHPEVVQRQQMLWDAKFQQLCKVLRISKADLERKARTDEQLANSPEKPKRRRTSSTRSRTKSGGEKSLSDLSDADGDAITKADRARRHSGTGRSRMNLAPAREPDPTALETINGSTMPAVSAELKKELMRFVHEKLTTRYVLSMSDLRRQFDLQLTQCPPGHILGRGVSDRMLEQSVYDVGGNSVAQTDEAIFALPKLGDPLDPVRAVLFENLNNNKIRSSTIRKRLEEQYGEDAFSESDVKKILKDYCASKGGFWHLKGTLTDS